LLAGKLVPIVVIHSLGGSHANRHHTSNPQSGAAQPTQDEDHTSHEQSTRVPFDSPPGKDQEHLTITMIGAGVGSRCQTRGGVNSPFLKLSAPSNRNKYRIKTIGLAKTTHLYLSSQAPCKDPK
jgi:hypothetical protein